MWLHQFLFCLLCLSVASATSVVRAEQSINPVLQALKQESLLLDSDLLVLEEQIKQPLTIYLSQKTDSKFVIETMVIKLNGETLVGHNYNDSERLALKKGGAQLIYTGIISPGKHKLIAYYRSNKDYQAGAEFDFENKSKTQVIEISLRKGDSKESRLQPKVIIEGVDIDAVQIKEAQH